MAKRKHSRASGRYDDLNVDFFRAHDKNDVAHNVLKRYVRTIMAWRRIR